MCINVIKHCFFAVAFCFLPAALGHLLLYTIEILYEIKAPLNLNWNPSPPPPLHSPHHRPKLLCDTGQSHYRLQVQVLLCYCTVMLGSTTILYCILRSVRSNISAVPTAGKLSMAGLGLFDKKKCNRRDTKGFASICL
jgi:hypothetical protein